MSDIQSAVNSFKLSFFKNNKTQNNNKVTEKLFAKYKLKSEDEQQKESQVDTSTIGLTLKDAVDSIFDPTTGMSDEALEIYTSAKSRISDDDPAREELNAAYDDAYGEFKKSEQYKKLPATEKEAKEKEKNGTSRSSWNKDITGDTKFTENEEETYEFGSSGDFEGEE